MTAVDPYSGDVSLLALVQAVVLFNVVPILFIFWR